LPPDVPLGLCPECLIKSGFPTGTEPGAAGEVAGTRFVPPPVEEIAQLFPQLEILGFIGKGGMGAVYKARQPALDRFVALKVLPPAVASDPGFAERFNREARALARLNHPNIVAVHDFGKAGALHYLLMEFVDGTNLREVEHAGRLSPEQALAIVPQICEALQFAHNEGIVHRDIKPENLLLDKKGRVKITDFGIAKIVGVPAGKVSLTGVKDVIGTPHYMAPEQIEKPQTVDHRADIYSLGVVFYEMLTGELPLGKFQPPSSRMGGVQIDVRLDEVVLHTLEKEPARRYQQVSQVKTDVETIAGTVPPAAGFGAKGGPVPLLATPSGKATSDKILLPTFLLAFFFGPFGAHRFYVGKTGTAILQLCTFGACGIWATIDWILILCKVFTDGEGKRITHWLHPKTGELQTAVSPVTGPPSTPPPGGTAPSAARSQPAPRAHDKTSADGTGKIVAPAVGLMVAGMLKLFLALTAMFFLSSLNAGWLQPMLENLGIGPFSGWNVPANFSLVILLLKAVPACLIFFGGLQMMQIRSYAWAIAAGILAIVCCSLVGFPVGIWALIILARQDVRETFANAARSQSPKTGLWPWILGTLAAVGMFVLIVLALPLIEKRNVTGTDAITGQSTAGARVEKAGESSGQQTVPVQKDSNAGIHQDASGEFRKNFSRSFPLNADGRFSLDHVKGRIEIHGWSSNAVVINATIHGKTSESVEAVKINIDSGPDEIVIHTEQPSSMTGFPWSWFWFKNSRRNDGIVDYAIQVPQNARLKTISSVNGRIVIEDVSGDIGASTVNGQMQVQGAGGDLKLSTVNGRIEAELASLGGSQTVSLSAVNGHIEAILPANADAEVAASTVNGGMSSEFPSLIVKKEFPLGSHLKGTLGSGGARVKASTVNGGISFRRGKDAQKSGAKQTEEEDVGQSVAGLPPVVVNTQPVSGARDVEPGVTEIRVRFSKEMADGSWSWSTAWENSAPEIIGQPHYESDGRTCVAKVKLEPGRTYAWWLNSNQFKNFTDLAGRPAVPYLLIFQTKQN
jgi:serine/threonine protein kinase